MLRGQGADHRAQVHAHGVGGALVGDAPDHRRAFPVRCHPVSILGDAPVGMHAGAHGRTNGWPLTGVEAMATSLVGIRPARWPSRPASTACLNARAMRTGSRACATTPFSSTPPTPNSI